MSSVRSVNSDPPKWLERMLRLVPVDLLGGGPIEIRQTHISAVLLGQERVLKLKKAVDFGFLDYTTLAKRQAACEAEVRLNSRMCPEIYPAVHPIRDEDGGPIIDHGVLMKRLPADRMLDELIRRDTATEATINRVVRRLADFHRTARRDPSVDAYGNLAVIGANWEENFRQTEPFVGRTISREAFDQIRAWIAERLERDRAIFERRIAEGRIVDGRGDVRCESVCVVNGICFFDCIEFNDRFRCGDVAGEIAFLAMDLDSLGRPDLGYYAAECYQRQAQDPELWSLLPFYRCYRAYVRGKVLSFRLDQPELAAAEKEQATRRATAFFDLARRYASHLERPTVILVCGRSGTGKTSLARGLAAELGLRVVSTDAVRQELLGANKQPAEFGEGAYTPKATQLTYEHLLVRASDLLARDGGVVVDGTFLRVEQRRLVGQMAHAAGATVKVIECRLSPEVVQQRLERRAERHEGLSDASWAIYLRQEMDQRSGDEPERNWFVAGTSIDLGASVCAASDWLRRP